MRIAPRGAHTIKNIKLLKYPRQTVYDVCKRFDEMGKEQRSAHNSRRDRILKPTFLAGFKRSINANPAVPMIELAKKRSVSVMTIKRGINKLGFNSYARGKKHRKLTEKMKEICFNRCKLISNLLKSNPSKIIQKNFVRIYLLNPVYKIYATFYLFGCFMLVSFTN